MHSIFLKSTIGYVLLKINFKKLTLSYSLYRYPYPKAAVYLHQFPIDIQFLSSSSISPLNWHLNVFLVDLMSISDFYSAEEICYYES